MPSEISLVYMVAGMANRFGGKIKGLMEVRPNGETLIEYSLNQALPYGFNKIIFIVSDKTFPFFKGRFRDLYRNIPITYAFQKYDRTIRDKPWGTADALCSASKEIQSSFVVCNGDDIYGSENFKTLYEHLINEGSSAAIGYNLLNNVPKIGSVNRGIFRTKNNYADEIKETFGINRTNLPDLGLSENDLCSMNMFALRFEDMLLLEERVKSFKERHAGDRKAECLLPSELSYLISNKLISLKIYESEYTCLGLTNPWDEIFLKEELLRRDSLFESV